MFTKPSLAIDQILLQQGSAQVRIQELKTCCSECVGACLLTGSSLGAHCHWEVQKTRGSSASPGQSCPWLTPTDFN